MKGEGKKEPLPSAASRSMIGGLLPPLAVIELFFIGFSVFLFIQYGALYGGIFLAIAAAVAAVGVAALLVLRSKYKKALAAERAKFRRRETGKK